MASINSSREQQFRGAGPPGSASILLALVTAIYRGEQDARAPSNP
ncbi:MAG TPA: hypothetical protein VN837_03355 [Chloroflexota bacterium]|nr:hypothetical protein [Chloroflexota bacterium]